MAINLNGSTGITTTGLTSNGIDDNATSTAMTLDASGSVGIGTSSPANLLNLYQSDTSSNSYLHVNHVDSGTGASNGLSIGLESNGTDAAFRNRENGSVKVYTNNTERMRIDSSGNVGIGTSSPNRLLSLYATQPVFQITNVASGNTQGTIQYQVSGSTQFNIDNQGSGSGGVITFMQAGSERMRIDSSGNLLVGGTSVSPATDDVAGIKLSATGAIQASVDGNAALFVNRKGAGDGTAVDFRKQGGQVGTISVTASSTAYNTSSDYRLKTDAQPMTGASARVQALNPVNFEWLSDGTRVDGFLAHEAQEVVPEAVTGTKDAMRDEEYEVTPAVYEAVVIPAVLDEEGSELKAERTEQQLVTEAVMGTRSVPDYQGIDQSKLVPLLTAALQEALTEISDLKARVTALEAV